MAAAQFAVRYVCDLCRFGTNEGLSHCSDCKLAMCDYCSLGHSKIPVTKHHKIIYREGLDLSTVTTVETDVEVDPQTKSKSSGTVTTVETNVVVDPQTESKSSGTVTTVETNVVVDPQTKSKSSGRVTTVETNVVVDPQTKKSPCVIGKVWKKILKTGRKGRERFGSKVDLIHAVKHGADVRIYADEWEGNHFVSNVQCVSYRNGEVSVQALMHVSKQSWESFQDNVYWYFMNVSTTGHVHIQRWLVGQHKKLKEETKRAAITWFVRETKDAASVVPYAEPVLHAGSNGNVISGSVMALSQAIEDGHDIRVITDWGLSSPLPCVETNNGLVVGQCPWHVSQWNCDNHKEFQTDAYWWFTMWSSDGTVDTSRWSIGIHDRRGHKEHKMELQWFTDSEVSLQYKHDEKGTVISGSISSLTSSILSGHRIKLVTNGFSLEPNHIQIKDGHVSAQVLSQLSKGTFQRFDNDVCWCWEHVCTDGRFDCVKYGVGDSVIRGNSEGTRALSWITDTLPWTHVLSTSKSGDVTYGNKSDLINSLTEGSMLRYIVKFQTETVVLQADNVELLTNDVGAQTIRTISYDNETPRKFQQNPYCVFTIATTKGQIHFSRWTVGKQEFRGSETINADIEWFVCQ